MADSPVDMSMNLDQGLVQSSVTPMRLLCAIADPILLQRFQQSYQVLNLDLEVQYVENLEQAIAPLYQTSFSYVVIEADFALDFLKLVQQKQWQIPAIALVREADDACVEILLKAGIADCLDHDQLTPQQLRRSFHHLQQLCQAQYQHQQLRQQLQLIDEHYRLTLDASNDGIWDWKLSQPHIEGNDRLWRMLGLPSQNQLVDLKSLKTRIHPQDYQATKTAFQRHLNDDEEFSVELRLRHERGEYRDFWVRGKLQRTGRQQQLRMCGLVTDITERKRSDRRNRFLSQASSLLNSSFDPRTTLENLAWLAIPRVADWCILDVNCPELSDRHIVTAHLDPTKEPLVLDFHQQLTPSHLNPTQVAQFSHHLTPADLAQLAQENGWSLPLLQSLGIQSYVWMPLQLNQHCLGSIFFAWGESGRYSSPADLVLVQELAYRATWAIENARLYDERQSVHRDLQGAIAKLTKEQQRLETLQHLTTLIHQRLTNIPELLQVLVQQICQDVPAAQVCSIALFDPKQEGDFLVVTDEMPRKTHPEADVCGIAFDQLLKQDKSWLHNVYQQGTPQLRNFDLDSPMPASVAAVVIESIASGRLGVLVIGNWHIAQAFDHEDCAFLSAVGEEAAIAIDNARLIKTLEQQNQELSETSRVKDLFIATVSHELRTPMNAILGFSQVLLNQRGNPLGDRQHQIVQRILSNGRSLMTLINDILDFSQMKLTELQLLPSTFNLEELVANIIAELQSLADQKQLQLSLFSDLRTPLITHDEKRLRQVLVNLVANALSFTYQGSVAIYLKEDQDQITIQVKDTGVGIAPEHLNFIFSEFWQVQQEIHRTKSGTGLGLAIAQSLVQRMHGAIAVESRLNQGSSFTVTLPRSFHLK